MISSTRMLAFTRKTAIVLSVMFLLTAAAQAQWKALGPDGGDVRSLTYDPRNPNRIFLGTSAGQLFLSNDDGATWSRFARVGERSHYVLDHVVFDPTRPGTIYLAAWSIEGDGGDVFRSTDDGRTWETLNGVHGKSIRAFAVAPSNPSVLVAGALDGVFRSLDGGNTWQRISPEHHAEIKNVESLAIDPRSPNVIYVGTWHLPWKTEDGGRTWKSIKNGVIDDSDVFSIIIDPRNPSVVYASACSGIYKSETAGAAFRKIQGIPFSARRTRVLQQDPSDSNVVYAGTTEGLWKTVDAGKTWRRLSPANLIINDVLVDPRRPAKVLLGTDRSGVLVSENGGQSFVASNRGFAHRQVTVVLVDRSNPNLLYAGLINDKEFGGVFVSRDAGEHWTQMSAGLEGRDVFSLRQAEDGSLLAGTNRGVFRMVPNEHRWQPINTLIRELPGKTVRTARGTQVRTAASVVKSELSARVADLAVASGKWFAATSEGVFSSEDAGQSWRGGPVQGERDFVALHVTSKMVAAVTPKRLMVSLDGGSTWYAARLPTYVTALFGVTSDANSTLWLASREGAFRSPDGGDTWEHVLAGLPARDVLYVAYDQERKRLLATARTACFESTDGGRNWRRTGETGWRLRKLSPSGGRLFAVTDFDGVMVQLDRGSEWPNRAASGGAAPTTE